MAFKNNYDTNLIHKRQQVTNSLINPFHMINQFIKIPIVKNEIFLARKMHLLLTRVVPLGLNGSDLEQMSDNKDGRLPLELVDI